MVQIFAQKLNTKAALGELFLISYPDVTYAYSLDCGRSGYELGGTPLKIQWDGQLYTASPPGSPNLIC